MQDTVRDIFPDFSRKFEGYVHWMYLDVKGLVTIGIGNLIDPISLAINLPFTKKNGSVASKQDITNEWNNIKTRKELAKLGHKAAANYCNLRLSDDAISDLVRSKLEQNEAYLIKNHFPDFNSWPADAQLAVLSMAWALGANFPAKWTQLKSYCLKRDWKSATLSCHINEVGNPGVKPRNETNVKLFNSASDIEQNNIIDVNDKNRIMNLVALTAIQSLNENV